MLNLYIDNNIECNVIDKLRIYDTNAFKIQEEGDDVDDDGSDSAEVIIEDDFSTEHSKNKSTPLIRSGGSVSVLGSMKLARNLK